VSDRIDGADGRADLPYTPNRPTVGQRFVRTLRKNPATAWGMLVVFTLIVIALLAPVIAPFDPYATDPTISRQPPSRAHLFGTGVFGDDIFSRVLYGARFDLIIAFGAVGIALVSGCLLGAVAGYWEGALGEAIMRVVELLQAFPAFILAMAIAGALGPSFRNLIIAIAITNIPIYAHLMRVSVMANKQNDYAMAAIALGGSSWRVLFRHLLPNSLGPIFIQSTLQPGYAILTAAGLSFIGLGVRIPEPEWGLMVAMGSARIISGEWWMSFFPGLFIILAVMGFNLIGDGLQDIFDPQRG
jgi:peptide/nickel transport system permease protein